MKGYWPRFNLFLALAALALLPCGCKSTSSLNPFKKSEPSSVLRIHMELAPDNLSGQMSATKTITLLRANPVSVTIDKGPILTEANLVAAKVISTPEAPAIELRFDGNGTWILEQYSAANPGRHFVIFGQWGDDLNNSRWLAAPLITQRINNGIISFTPDMSKDEADLFVKGLNNEAKKFQTTPAE
jgi:preprotein translocase subunit SecD